MITWTQVCHRLIINLAGSPYYAYPYWNGAQSLIYKVYYQKSIPFPGYFCAVLIAGFMLRLVGAQMHHAVIIKPASACIFLHRHLPMRHNRATVKRCDDNNNGLYHLLDHLIAP